MSNNYQPDNDATAGDPWNVAFLSDRDVSGQVPINYVPHPGVYLTSACFGNGTYEDQSFKGCFSNLLASEFRRFVFDIYWDSLNRQYRLCPVEIPPQSGNGTAEALNTAPVLSVRQVSGQDTSTTTLLVASNLTSSTPTTTSISTMPTTSSSSGTILYQIGPYSCSESLGLNTIFSVLKDYISASSLVIEARLQYIILNLHAASSIGSPTTPRQSLNQSQLPASNELINNYLDQNGALSYTPYLLRNDRANLNTSWFSRHNLINFPLLNYFTTVKLASGDVATPDGWPCENYLQLERGYRLLIGYGTVDDAIKGYNFEGDGSAIFSPGYLTSGRVAKIDSEGSLASGCFYSSTDNQINQLNASWATSAVMNIDSSTLGNAADNLSTCGISPMLNTTLDFAAASVNYQSFGNQALFSWAVDEPMNASEAGISSRSANVWRCALVVSDDTYKGHWRVADCRKKYRVACREANQPYVWALSTLAVPYDAASEACIGNTTFDVPRVGLENLYLYNHIRAISTSQQDSSTQNGVWINFNSLDTEDCWVTTGLNGTCSYSEGKDTVRQRTILVPTIASFVTLLITALTILVKCNTNRRKSRTRKRGEGGWDYEGVPS